MVKFDADLMRERFQKDYEGKDNLEILEGILKSHLAEIDKARTTPECKAELTNSTGRLLAEACARAKIPFLKFLKMAKQFPNLQSSAIEHFKDLTASARESLLMKSQNTDNRGSPPSAKLLGVSSSSISELSTRSSTQLVELPSLSSPEKTPDASGHTITSIHAPIGTLTHLDKPLGLPHRGSLNPESPAKEGKVVPISNHPSESSTRAPLPQTAIISAKNRTQHSPETNTAPADATQSHLDQQKETAFKAATPSLPGRQHGKMDDQVLLMPI
jgi:hypothetical protein